MFAAHLPNFWAFAVRCCGTQGNLDQSNNYCGIMLTMTSFWHQPANQFRAGVCGHAPFSAFSCWMLQELEFQVGI